MHHIEFQRLALKNLLTDEYFLREEGAVSNPHSLPTEQECIDGLANMITANTARKEKLIADKTNANDKLKALGLTDDEIKAIKGIE